MRIILSALIILKLFLIAPAVFSQIPPENLILWLKADNVEIIDDKVATWYDNSGNNFHPTQATVSRRPLQVISSDLANNYVIRFDGVDDFLKLAFGEVFPQPLTLFILWSNKRNSGYPLSGFDNAIEIYTGNNIVGARSGGFNFDYARPTPFVSIITSVIYNHPNSKLYENGTQKRQGSTGTESLNGVTIGGRFNTTLFLEGDVAEIIAYSGALPDVDRNNIETYLMNKYSTPLSLGEDISIDYGFCSVPLAISPSFTDILWSTGETTNSIEVSESGEYFVEAKDIFGRLQFDTINVSLLELEIANQLICLGDSALFTVGLIGDYEYLWHDNSTNDTIFIHGSGDYWLQITDNLSCSVTIDFSLEVDNYSELISLGEDVTLCTGNYISLISGAEETVSYIWYPGESTNDVLYINEEGWYKVITENANGCKGIDSIYVSIKGEAPTPLFDVQNLCLGQITQFMDLSYPQDSIASYTWIFNNQDTLYVQNPEYEFATSGINTVELILSSHSGCVNDIIVSIEILKTPEISFSYLPVCVNIEMDFVANVNIPDGHYAVSYSWYVDDVFVSDQINYSFNFSNPGEYTILFVVEIDNGCAAYYEEIVEVKSNYPIPSNFSTIHPKNNYITDNREVLFEWNYSDNAQYYELIIATDDTFNEIIYTSEKILTNFYSAIIPNEIDSIFWKVIAYNPCLVEKNSNVNLLFFYSPDNIGNLILWLRADSVDIINEKVAGWYDLSGNGFNPIQSTESRRPIQKISTTLANNYVVCFDGLDDLLRVTFNETFNQPITVFVLWNNNKSIGYPISGFDDVFEIYTGTNLLGARSGGFNFQYTRATPFNFLITSVLFNHPASKIYENEIFKLQGSTGTNNFTGVTVGARFNNTAYLEGEIAEILAFSGSVNDSIRHVIHNYLYNKYAPPINLGADIRITNGFCPVTIDAGERFESYLWSTGETTQSIEVNEPGIYGVTVVDIFGFVSSDSLKVRYPDVRLSQRDTIICFGDNLVLGIQGDILPSYTYLWKRDGINISTNQSIITDIAGLYELHVIDENDCFLTLRLDLDVDMFSETTSLGEDREFCMGGELEVVFGFTPKSPKGDLNSLPSGGMGGKNSTPLPTDDLRLPTYDLRLPTADLSVPEALEGTGNGYRRVTEELQEKVTGSGYRRVTEELQEKVTGSSDSATPNAERQTLYPIPYTPQHSALSTQRSALSFLWSTGATTPSIIINEPGTYSVTVINEIGCIAESEVTLGLQGYAPVVVFDAAAVCFGEPLVFTDQSYVDESEIVSWQWEFNDPGIAGGGSSVEQNPEFEYSTAGIFDINLSVTSAAGCVTDITEQVQVYHLPQPAFKPINACHNINIEFTDLSTSIDGLIENTHWSFIDSDGIIQYESDENNPIFMFDTPGDWEISLITESDKGCSNEIIKEIFVRESPEIEFGYTAACTGEPVHFANLTTGPAWTTVIELLWDFGDGSQSNQNNPSHLYLEDGEFSVTLEVKSVNGCIISLTKDILVSANPEASFSTPSLCKNTPHLFEDETFVPTGEEITAWLWNFGDGNQSNLQDPVHAYSETGQYEVMLTVESSAGCKGSRSSLVDVFPAPVSDFSFYPRYGVSPLVVSFNNLSEGAQSYFWDFGDGAQYSNQENPSHTYTENGIYFPSLVATSELGCNDTISYEIKVIPLSIDIAITDVVIKRLGNYLEISAGLFNLGTLDLDTIFLNLRASGSRPIRETWTGLLRAGDITSYTFNAQLPDYTGKDYDYVCVEALIPLHNPDDNPENNYKCQPLEDSFTVIPPYPNPAGNSLNTGFIIPYRDKVTVEIFDIYGNSWGTVYNEITEAGFTYLPLDISQLRGGVYFIRVTFRDGNLVKRFVKS